MSYNLKSISAQGDISKGEKHGTSSSQLPRCGGRPQRRTITNSTQLTFTPAQFHKDNIPLSQSDSIQGKRRDSVFSKKSTTYHYVPSQN